MFVRSCVHMCTLCLSFLTSSSFSSLVIHQSERHCNPISSVFFHPFQISLNSSNYSQVRLSPKEFLSMLLYFSSFRDDSFLFAGMLIDRHVNIAYLLLPYHIIVLMQEF